MTASIVGTYLGDGVRVTCDTPALRGTAHVVGTNNGNVLALYDVDSELVPVFSQAMHCGRVYDVAVSTAQLVATAGHDACCCVFPLRALFDVPCGANSSTEPGISTITASVAAAAGEKGKGASASRAARPTAWHRFSPHSLPVVQVKFFSDGRTLASLSIDGELAVHDTTTGACIASVRCGFAARALALSADETCCFVGGTHIARVDLFSASRTTTLQHADPMNRGAVGGEVVGLLSRLPPCVRLYSWCDEAGKSENHVHGPASHPKPKLRYSTPPGTLITALRVSPFDGSVTATFTTRQRSASSSSPSSSTPPSRSSSSSEEGEREVVSAEATWRQDYLIQEDVSYDYRPLPASTDGAAGRRVHRKRVRGVSTVTSAAASAPSPSELAKESRLRPCPPVWRSWPLMRCSLVSVSTACEEGDALLTHTLSTPWPTVELAVPSAVKGGGSMPSESLTTAERLVMEEERGRKLQEECDELVRQLKEAMAKRKKKVKA